jgi:hypothetical protein
MSPPRYAFGRGQGSDVTSGWLLLRGQGTHDPRREPAVILRIFTSYADGMPPTQIVKTLNEENVPGSIRAATLVPRHR